MAIFRFREALSLAPNRIPSSVSKGTGTDNIGPLMNSAYGFLGYPAAAAHAKPSVLARGRIRVCPTQFRGKHPIAIHL